MAWEGIERHRGTWSKHPEEMETALVYMAASRAKRDRVEDYLRRYCAEAEPMWRVYLILFDDTGIAKSDSDGERQPSEEETEVTYSQLNGLLPKADRLDPAESEAKKAVFFKLLQCPEPIYLKALQRDLQSAWGWFTLGTVLSHNYMTKEAEVAFRNAVRLGPKHAVFALFLGIFAYCTLNHIQETITELDRARQLEPEYPLIAAIAIAAARASGAVQEEITVSQATFRQPILVSIHCLVQSISWFGKLLTGICDLAQEIDPGNRFAPLYRAIAHAQLGASTELPLRWKMRCEAIQSTCSQWDRPRLRPSSPSPYNTTACANASMSSTARNGKTRGAPFTKPCAPSKPAPPTT